MASEEAKKQEKAAAEPMTFEEDDTFEEFTMPGALAVVQQHRLACMGDRGAGQLAGAMEHQPPSGLRRPPLAAAVADGETNAAEDEGQGLWQPDWDDEDNKEVGRGVDACCAWQLRRG